MNSATRLAGLSLAAVLVAGCEGPAPTARTFNHLHLPAVSKDKAFNAAADAMRERFRIARMDPNACVIVSVPEEATDVVNQGRVGDVVGVERRVRKIATTKVTGSDAHADVWCKVVVEQFESEERYLFDQEHGSDDLPTATAADRDGAVTPEQSAVWRTIRRDKQTERSVLRAIAELVGRSDKATATQSS